MSAVPWFVAEIEALKQQNAELLATLVEARGMVYDWARWADMYIRKNQDIEGDLAKLDAVIAKAEGSGL